MNHDSSIQTRLNLIRALIYGSIASVGMIVLIVVVRLALPQLGAVSDAKETAEDGDSTQASATEVEKPDPAQVLQDEIARARSKAALVGFRSRVEEVNKEHKALVAESTALQSQIASLLTSDEGRQLAESDNNINVYLAISQKSRMSRSQMDALKTQLDELANPVLNIAAEDLAAPIELPEGYAAEVEVISRAIRPELDEVREDKQVLESIVRTAVASGPSASRPSSGTLQQAIAKLKAEERDATATRLAQARREEVEQKRGELVQAEKDKVAAEKNVELARIEQERRMREQEAAEIAEQAEARQRAFEEQQSKEELERELARDMRTVRSVLSPFITPARTQIGQRGFGATLEPTPVSFSGLKGAGALEVSLDGVHELFLLGNTTANGRPRGGFPGPYKSLAIASRPEIRVAVQEAQALLNKYGPLLVEQGLLAP